MNTWRQRTIYLGLAWLIGLLLGAINLVSADSGSQVALKKNVDMLLGESEEMSGKIADLHQQTESLANEINSLKKTEQSRRSLFEQLKLEKLLKDSGELAKQLDGYHARQERLNRTLEQRLRRLLDLYEEELQKLHNQSRSDSKKRPAEILLPQINQLQNTRRWYQDKLNLLMPQGSKIPTLPDFNVSASGDDSPQDLQEKSDLLKDVEEKISHKIGEIEKRLQELAETRTMLRETADFMDENSFFAEARFKNSSTAKSSGQASGSKETANSGDNKNQNGASQPTTESDAMVNPQDDADPKDNTFDGSTPPVNPLIPAGTEPIINLPSALPNTSGQESALGDGVSGSDLNNAGQSALSGFMNKDLSQILSQSSEMLLQSSYNLGSINQMIKELAKHKKILHNKAEEYHKKSLILQKQARDLLDKEKIQP